MPDDTTHQERLKRGGAAAGLTGILQAKDADGDDGEASCGAFGYLRGLRDQSAAIEFRFRDGNSMWFPYRSMGPWQYNPSEGLLLQFNSDAVHLVLIRGSNLARPLNEGAINLTHAGLQRHRVLWVREMSDDEIARVGETGPTIDTIEVVEFDSRASINEWIGKKAPAFLRSPSVRQGGPGR